MFILIHYDKAIQFLKKQFLEWSIEPDLARKTVLDDQRAKATGLVHMHANVKVSSKQIHTATGPCIKGWRQGASF